MFPLRTFRGFTLVELLVSIVIVAILAVLLSKGASEMTRKGAAGTCAANLRQLAAGLHLYVAEHDGALPIGADARPNPSEGSWVSDVASYVAAEGAKVGNLDRKGKVFVCPVAPKKERPDGSYFANRGLMPSISSESTDPAPVRFASISNPSLTVMLYEGYKATSVAPADTWSQFAGTSWNGPGRMPHGPRPPSLTRDAAAGDAMNVLYADGHVQFFILTKKPPDGQYLARPGGNNNLLGPGTTTKP